MLYIIVLLYKYYTIIKQISFDETFFRIIILCIIDDDWLNHISLKHFTYCINCIAKLPTDFDFCMAEYKIPTFEHAKTRQIFFNVYIGVVQISLMILRYLR